MVPTCYILFVQLMHMDIMHISALVQSWLVSLFYFLFIYINM
jgi:hypothetical protein